MSLRNSYSYGLYYKLVEEYETLTSQQLFNAIEIFYSGLLFLVKLAILLQYVHIFQPRRAGKTYWTILVIIGVNFLFYTASIFAFAFSCSPRERIWDKNVPGHCISSFAIYTTTSIFNILSDFILLLLPIGFLWRLRMSGRKKRGMAVIFATGLL